MCDVVLGRIEGPKKGEQSHRSAGERAQANGVRQSDFVHVGDDDVTRATQQCVVPAET